MGQEIKSEMWEKLSNQIPNNWEVRNEISGNEIFIKISLNCIYHIKLLFLSLSLSCITYRYIMEIFWLLHNRLHSYIRHLRSCKSEIMGYETKKISKLICIICFFLSLYYFIISGEKEIFHNKIASDIYPKWKIR